MIQMRAFLMGFASNSVPVSIFTAKALSYFLSLNNPTTTLLLKKLIYNVGGIILIF